MQADAYLNFFLFLKMKKKGFSLSTETLVYLLIALLILIFLMFLFGEQANNFVEKLRGFFNLVNNTG
jgi:hypothetical protein